MRKITSESVNAFFNGENYKSGNMEVRNTGVAMELRLHGNLIAMQFMRNKFISIQNCGWFTNTTKERLNALPNVSIQQKKGEWFLNGEKWNGQIKDISLNNQIL